MVCLTWNTHTQMYELVAHNIPIFIITVIITQTRRTNRHNVDLYSRVETRKLISWYHGPEYKVPYWVFAYVLLYEANKPNSIYFCPLLKNLYFFPRKSLALRFHWQFSAIFYNTTPKTDVGFGLVKSEFDSWLSSPHIGFRAHMVRA